MKKTLGILGQADLLAWAAVEDGFAIARMKFVALARSARIEKGGLVFRDSVFERSVVVRELTTQRSV